MRSTEASAVFAPPAVAPGRGAARTDAPAASASAAPTLPPKAPSCVASTVGVAQLSGSTVLLRDLAERFYSAVLAPGKLSDDHLNDTKLQVEDGFAAQVRII